MKITHAAVTRERIALRHPFVTALRRTEAVEYVRLLLRTETGLEAAGSAPATQAVTGETLDSIEQRLRNTILPAIMNRPLDLDALLNNVRNCCRGSGSAKAAADTALHFLAAAEKGIPLFRMLGADRPASLQTAVTVSLDTPESMRDKAAEAWHSGMHILKIKVGGNDGYDVQRIRAVAAAVPDASLLVDANQAWDAAATMIFIEAVSDLDIALIEQPVAADDLEALAKITAYSPFPILADEAVFTAEDAQNVLEMRAADLINIKLMKCGGIAEAQKIVTLCRRYDTRCMLGSMLEGPESITAALHLAAAYPDIFEWIDLDSPLLYDRIPEDLPFTMTANRYGL